MVAKKPVLRAVAPDERPVKKIMSVLDAVQHGSRIDEMVQTHLVLARAVDNPNTSSRDLAALTRRQLEISREIELLKRQQVEEAEENAVSEDEEFDAEAI